MDVDVMRSFQEIHYFHVCHLAVNNVYRPLLWLSSVFVNPKVVVTFWIMWCLFRFEYEQSVKATLMSEIILFLSPPPPHLGFGFLTRCLVGLPRWTLGQSFYSTVYQYGYNIQVHLSASMGTGRSCLKKWTLFFVSNAGIKMESCDFIEFPKGKSDLWWYFGFKERKMAWVCMHMCIWALVCVCVCVCVCVHACVCVIGVAQPCSIWRIACFWYTCEK